VEAPDIDRSSLIARLEPLVGAPVALEDLKRRPGRWTARATGPRCSAIVKVHGFNRAPLIVQRIGALASGPEEPVVPRVLDYAPEDGLVVLSEVPGTSLRDSLLAGALSDCERAGAVLGGWHRAFWGADPEGLVGHTVEDHLEVLRLRAEQAPRVLADRVMEAAGGLASPWDAPTVIHRDLQDEHVLLGHRVGLIDLDDAALGPPELDLANLAAGIEVLSLRRRRDLSAPLRAILRRYAACGPALSTSLLERCWALALLRRVAIHRLPELLERTGAPPASLLELAAEGGERRLAVPRTGWGARLRGSPRAR
jgi:Ser/Thr protein kinase RdoA (MazF antagonist)